MMTRPAHPVIYEINTWVWLGELSRRYGRRIRLGDVPAAEWDNLDGLRADALWLMGVWERSPAGIRITAQNEGLIAQFRETLPDFSPQDNAGSPYCVRRYVVDANLGGPEGLREARRTLARRNIALILDFIPNHVAPDHDWVTDHPEYFIRGGREDLAAEAGSYMQIGKRIFACGRDPHYPAWPDVLQLNAFHPGLREAMAEAVTTIAGQCDGIRCDMAMLVMNAVFAGTWGPRAGPEPAQEFWPQMIRAVHEKHAGFLFLAEAYWDLEWQLQQQGFDFCYDKRLYDRLEHGNAESVRLHLCADSAYQDRLIRFIENHDEPRAAAAFPAEKSRAAAVTASTVPGARLFHEGQFEGRRVRLPVFLGRRPHEPPDPDARAFYRRLLEILDCHCIRNGEWRLCERTGPPGGMQLVAWAWRNEGEYRLIVVNLSEQRARGTVRLPWSDTDGGLRSCDDLFSGRIHEVQGGEVTVDLPAWGFHILGCR